MCVITLDYFKSVGEIENMFHFVVRYQYKGVSDPVVHTLITHRLFNNASDNRVGQVQVFRPLCHRQSPARRLPTCGVNALEAPANVWGETRGDASPPLASALQRSAGAASRGFPLPAGASCLRCSTIAVRLGESVSFSPIDGRIN